MNRKGQLFGIWLILAIMITGAVGFPTVAVQQSYRQNANDPQIEITQEVAAAIQKGIPRDQIVGPTGNVDMATSLSPFIAIYDENAKVVGSSGKLNNENPVPPSGAFDTAKQTGNIRFTWQPQPGVRIAAVMQEVKGDKTTFVLAGRSLREVEQREKQLTEMAGLTWLAPMLLSLFLVWFINMLTLSRPTMVTENTEVIIVEEANKPDTSA